VSFPGFRRFREPAPRSGLILALVSLFALGFLPQLAGPGYDAALVSGLVLPATAAVVAALDSAALRPTASVALARGAVLGVVLALAGFAVLLVHGLRVGFCDPSEGLWLYVLGPGFGAALAGVWGGLVGLAAGAVGAVRTRRVRRVVAVALGLAGPLGCIGVSLYRFVSSPMVFAFDPFFGVFSGPLYDTVVNVVDRLVSYRAGTLATLTAATLGAATWDLARERGLRPALLERPGTALLALVTATLSLVHSASGSRLGHWSTAASIEAALGARRTGQRCDVIHPRSLSVRDATLFTRDCDARVKQVEAFFRARGPERILVYVFASEAEKGWLMGASHTYIAKPWRDEVYVQGAQFPHPVLSHELAHVIAGSFGQGPFKIAGALGGLLPDPGRIEGFAVAAAPDETDELTSLEWAASMAKLGILPPLSAVFELDFLSLTASKAYTVAGAFVSFLQEGYGAEAIRRWYGGASLPEAFRGKNLATLEREFHAALTKLAIPERALATAKTRFERPAFFARRCPRIVDRALGDAGGKLGAGDVKGAEEAYRSALRLDPRNIDARFGLAACARRRGDADAALKLYGELARASDLTKLQVAGALETSGDIELSRDQGPKARHLYAQVLELVFDEDRRRTVEVKQVSATGPGRRAIVALLIGERDLLPGWAIAAPLIQQWAAAEPTNGTPWYLIGRNLLLDGHYAESIPYFERALSLASGTSVRWETLRLRLVAGCAVGGDPRVQALLPSVEEFRAIPEARKLGVRRLVERCSAEPLILPSTLFPSTETTTQNSPDQPKPAGCPAGMQRIPGDKFWVGSNPDDGFADDESPAFLTHVSPFCVDSSEVTARDYGQCVERGACKVPVRKGILCNYGRTERDNHPINCVTWHDAEAYCAARGARLPGEVEQEYVARGGVQYLKYPWGDAPLDQRTCWKQPRTCPVGSFPAGAFGLLDVSGNVWEWSADWYGPYPWPPLEGSAKVYRGGSFSRRFEKWMHTRLRNRSRPTEAGAHLGFRCASSLPLEPCPLGWQNEREGTTPTGASRCVHTVLERACPEGKRFNGARCAAEGEPRCGPGRIDAPGHGCVLETPEEAEPEDIEASAKSVKSERTAAFDADCGHISRDRSRAFRYVGGSHAARNLVSRRSGCKNRDVGVGWNSTCCP
jgi:formylglycine-generating enzyme required for sulfatase activity